MAGRAESGGLGRTRSNGSVGFDRGLFQKAVQNRVLQHVQSHRENIVVPIGDISVFHDNKSMSGSMTQRALNIREDHRIGPQNWGMVGSRIKTPRRVPKEHSTEYHTEFNKWAGQLAKPLKESFMMTYNDTKTQQATLIDITKFDRAQLRTAVCGWGPHMRQVYLPELSTDNPKIHEHYLKQGICHVYRAPDGNQKTYGTESVREKAAARPDLPREPTEYRGQFCKGICSSSSVGALSVERTTHSLDGACDYGLEDDKLRKKVAEIHTRRDQTLFNEFRKKLKLSHTVLPHQDEPSSPRTKPFLKPRIGPMGNVHKDMSLETSYVGPCSLSQQRSGFRTGVVSPTQEHITYEFTTRNHTRAHKHLEVKKSREYERAVSPAGKGDAVASPKAELAGKEGRVSTVPVSPLAMDRSSCRDRPQIPEYNLKKRTNQIKGWSHKVGSPLRTMSDRQPNPVLGRPSKVFAEGRRGTEAMH